MRKNPFSALQKSSAARARGDGVPPAEGRVEAAHIAVLNARPICAARASVAALSIYTALDRCDRDGWDHWSIRARVVATRRFKGSLQHAKLYCGTIEERDIDFLIFNYHCHNNFLRLVLFSVALDNF